MKKLVPILVSFALMFSLAACGGNSSSTTSNSSTAASGNTSSSGSDASGGDNKKDVTLRVAWWGGQSRHDYTLEVIKLYQQKYPHVTIETEYAAFDDYWKKLAPQAAANQLPDVIQMDISYLSQYGTRGQLADLEPFIQSGALHVNDISENNLSGGKLGGKLLAINLGSNALSATVDEELLKASGIETPLKEDWTWTDFDALGEKLKASGKMIVADLRHDVFFPFFLRMNNQHMYNGTDYTLGYDDDKYFVDFYTMYKGWYDKGYLLSLDKLAQKKGTPEDDEMVMGNAAAAIGWSNQYLLAANTANRPLAMQPVPGWSSNGALFLKPSMFFAVSESSAIKEEAAKFIDFFVNDIEANKIIKGERGVPVSSKVRDELKPLLSEQETKIFEYVAWAEQNSTAMDPPNPVGAVEVDKLLKDTVEQILYNKTSVEDAAKKFREDANKILAKNKP
ncbi:ABC transporter substrate-binding protein [Paenibacillus sp. SYP-B4298]|uniref:ABC transporter substrate-binding protein n=1 Tax=Paenibacillus sp. SYP-B4298 TaxID=2996034 RepID=UPI0022DD916B|nr:extracellular solute-binding protein [Paenibacillus sp. SYP-B4298]